MFTILYILHFQLSLTEELQPLPKFDTPPLISPRNNISLDVIDPAKNEALQIKEKLLSVLNNAVDPADAKVYITLLFTLL